MAHGRRGFREVDMIEQDVHWITTHQADRIPYANGGLTSEVALRNGSKSSLRLVLFAELARIRKCHASGSDLFDKMMQNGPLPPPLPIRPRDGVSPTLFLRT
jgi:hypothetical protein